MRLLVTNGEYIHALAILRCLSKNGINTSVLFSNINAICKYSRYCSNPIRISTPINEQQYVDSILSIIQNNNYDILIPVGYRENSIVSRYYDLFSPYISMVTASYNQIDICLNKRKTHEHAAKVGVPFPMTFYPKDIDDLDSVFYIFSYPVIIKGLWEAGKNLVDIANNPEDLRNKYNKMCLENNFKNESLPMIQEFISDENYTYGFGAFYINGKCKRFFMHKEIRSVPVLGGSGACLESFYDEKLMNYGLKLLDSLHWHGIALVEFKKKDDDFLLMEINPKFWASIDLAIKCGVEFPLYYCNVVKGEKLDNQEAYPVNIRYHFPISREIIHAVNEKKSLPAIVKDCLDCRVKSNLQLTDPLPGIQELFKTLKKIGYLHLNTPYKFP